jgi:alkyl sulfatase BDS1-like metallo-beta-lactamase superfamily hydrolase
MFATVVVQSSVGDYIRGVLDQSRTVEPDRLETAAATAGRASPSVARDADRLSVRLSRYTRRRASSRNSEIVINWRFADKGESIASTLEHGALTSITGKAAANARATVTTTRTEFETVIMGQRTLADAMALREITTGGDAKPVPDLLALLVDFDPGFPTVEPWTLTMECVPRLSGR